MSRPRKTLAQMAAEAQHDAGGAHYICPRCGAHEWRGEQNSEVETTRHPDGRITTVRYRLCQCGKHRFRTEETVVPAGKKLKVVSEDEDERACA